MQHTHQTMIRHVDQVMMSLIAVILSGTITNPLQAKEISQEKQRSRGGSSADVARLEQCYDKAALGKTQEKSVVQCTDDARTYAEMHTDNLKAVEAVARVVASRDSLPPAMRIIGPALERGDPRSLCDQDFVKRGVLETLALPLEREVATKVARICWPEVKDRIRKRLSDDDPRFRAGACPLALEKNLISGTLRKRCEGMVEIR